MEGTFVSNGDYCYITSEGDESSKKIIVDDDSLLDKLLDVLPCYVGGKYLYKDISVISGTLCIDATASKIYFSDVERLIIKRDSKEFFVV